MSAALASSSRIRWASWYLLSASVGRVPDGRQPHPAVLGQAADHVEDDADLPGLVEVQPVPGDDVEEVVRHQAAQQVGLEVVGRDEVLLLAVGVRNSAVAGS